MRLDLAELSDEQVAKLGEHLTLQPRREALLTEYKEGSVVSVEGRSSTSVVTAVMTETFDFPTGREDGETVTEMVEASSQEPVYIVAFVSGSMMAVDGSQLSTDSFDTEKGKDAQEVKELADKSEEAAVYDYMDDYSSYDELQRAKKQVMLAQSNSLSGVESRSVEELVNVPGVDDPHVGFDSLPNGWTRKSVLQAWASLGGSFTSCRAGMTGEIRNPTRFCAALKDEVLRTELWRNRF